MALSFGVYRADPKGKRRFTSRTAWSIWRRADMVESFSSSSSASSKTQTSPSLSRASREPRRVSERSKHGGSAFKLTALGQLRKRPGRLVALATALVHLHATQSLPRLVVKQQLECLNFTVGLSASRRSTGSTHHGAVASGSLFGCGTLPLTRQSMGVTAAFPLNNEQSFRSSALAICRNRQQS